MSRINAGRVVLGGLLAGLVINLIDFVVNVPILGARWSQYSRALGVDESKVGTGSALGWIASDFIFAILLVWLYAAIRPRFGPGPRTAVLASVVVWFISHVAYYAFVFMGLYPMDMILCSALGALIACLAGGQLGCWLYREA
jgi:hypothetical protein